MSKFFITSDLKQFESDTFKAHNAMNSICYITSYKMKYVLTSKIRRSTRYVNIDDAITALELSIKSLGARRMEQLSKTFRTTILNNLYTLKEQL